MSFRKINKQLKKNIKLAILKNKNFNPADNHYIFSDPRGGSTWLMETIQKITQEPVIWEPLHLGVANNPFNDIDFGWRQHIPEDAQWDDAKHLFDSMFEFKILQNCLQFDSIKNVKESKSLLFKICRANKMLLWLVANYDFKHPPLYLIRHPFAVVASQLHQGSWDYSFDSFKIPDTRFNAMYKEHEAFLSSIQTKEEALVAEWCMSNLDNLKHPHNNKKWLTLNYEEFVLNPVKTIERILQVWKIDFDVSTIDFNQNSSSTKLDSPEETIKRISAWQQKLTKKQIDAMGKVLDYFKVPYYSKDNALPEVIFNYG